MVLQRGYSDMNQSTPIKPLRAGEVYNVGDLMPPTPSSALPQNPMTERRNKGKEKEIIPELLRYQQTPSISPSTRYRQRSADPTNIYHGNQFGANHSIANDHIADAKNTICSFPSPFHCLHTSVDTDLAHNSYGLPSPDRENFVYGIQYVYPNTNGHLPLQSSIVNSSQPITSTSAQEINNLSQSIGQNDQLENWAKYVDSIFLTNVGLYQYYWYERPTTIFTPQSLNGSIFKSPNKENSTMANTLEPSLQQLNQVLQHQTMGERSIDPTTNKSPQSSMARSHSGATSSQSHDNLLTVAQENSAASAVTSRASSFSIKDEVEFHQSQSSVMRAPELTRTQSIGMDDLSPHDDHDSSGSEDPWEYGEAEDFLVPDASITDLDVGLDCTPIQQGVRFPGDQYTPIWVRFQGKQRQGRCEQCVHQNRKLQWFKMRTSQYLYHKLNAHGIIHATGRQFAKPVDVIYNVNGTREGWCSHCQKYQVAFSPRCRPPMSRWAPWYRHVSHCHPVYSYRKRSRLG